MIEQIGIKMLAELDPAGAAGGDHRQRSAFFDPFQQFIAFFDNGEVGRKIGVEYFVKSQPAQSGNHFSGDQTSRGHTEFFAQRGANGRSFLNDDMFGRVLQRFPD